MCENFVVNDGSVVVNEDVFDGNCWNLTKESIQAVRLVGREHGRCESTTQDTISERTCESGT